MRSWTFDEGSWRRSSRGDTAGCLMLVSSDRSRRWMQLDSRRGQLRSVGQSLVNRCPGFDISLVWLSRDCKLVTASRYVS